MKQLVSAFLVWLCAFNSFAQTAPQLKFTNNTVEITVGDSYWKGVQDKGSVGYKANWIVGSYGINKHPELFISYRDYSSSGSGNGAFNALNLPGFAAIDCGGAGTATNILLFVQVSSNEGRPYQGIYDQIKISCTFPFTNYVSTNQAQGNYSTLTNDWPFQSRVGMVVFGDIPYNDGRDASAYSDGGRDASLEAGFFYVDSFRILSPYVLAHSPKSELYIDPNRDHPGNEIEGAWGLASLFYPTNSGGLGADTNIFTFVLNASDVSITSTSDCVVSSFTGNETNLSFTLLTTGMGPSKWVPDGRATNDSRGAFDLVPGLADKCLEMMRVTGLRAGNWRVTWDSAHSYVLSSTVLVGGHNLYTNYDNPFNDQQMLIFEDFCVMHDISYTNLMVDVHPVDNRLVENVLSFGRFIWSTNTLGMSNFVFVTKFLRDPMLAQDIVIHNHAQQVPHSVLMEWIPPSLPTKSRLPFHR